MKDIILRSFTHHKEALDLIEKETETIEHIAKLFIKSLANKGKIIFMGNGGSAADAQHLAAELVGRFKKNRVSLPAIALSANISIITAIGNDFGFENIFTRQIESLASTNDIVVGLSTSGKSKNIINAVKKSQESGIYTVGFLGKDGGEMLNLVDTALVVSSLDTPRIQEMHILVGHIICEIVEEHFVKS